MANDVLEVWIARNDNGDLRTYLRQPKWDGFIAFWTGTRCHYLPPDEFPSVQPGECIRAVLALAPERSPE